MSMAIIDEFFENEELTQLPQKKHRSRRYLRKAFFKKERNVSNSSLKNANYSYVDNSEHVRCHIYDLSHGKNINSHGIKLEIVNRDKNTIDVLVKNSINNSSDIIRAVHHIKTSKPFWTYEHLASNGVRHCYPVYYKKYYPNSSFGKVSANRSVRNYKAFDDEGFEIAPPNGNWYRKIFNSWEICDW